MLLIQSQQLADEQGEQVSAQAWTQAPSAARRADLAGPLRVIVLLEDRHLLLLDGLRLTGRSGRGSGLGPVCRMLLCDLSHRSRVHGSKAGVEWLDLPHVLDLLDHSTRVLVVVEGCSEAVELGVLRAVEVTQGERLPWEVLQQIVDLAVLVSEVDPALAHAVLDDR